MLPLLLAAALSAPSAAPSPAPIHAAATLTSPHDILVSWTDPATPSAAGHAVEWGVSPDDEFVVLGFLPPPQATFKHEDLIPDTTCYYRVRAFYGPASAEVEASLPQQLSDAAYVAAFAQPEDYHWAVPETDPQRAAGPKHSVHDPASAAAAAPADFKVTLVPTTISGLKLTWTDRSSDEDGFMIEMKPDGSSTFQVVAIVKPNVNGFGWAFNPPVRH